MLIRVRWGVKFETIYLLVLFFLEGEVVVVVALIIIIIIILCIIILIYASQTTPTLLARRQGTNSNDPSSRWITDSISYYFLSQPYSFLLTICAFCTNPCVHICNALKLSPTAASAAALKTNSYFS